MTAPAPKLTTPKLRIVTKDGDEHFIQALNTDMCEWDRQRARNNWPKTEDAPFPWMNFLAWHAAKREGLFNGMSLKDFETFALEVSVMTNESQTVNPTNREAAPA